MRKFLFFSKRVLPVKLLVVPFSDLLDHRVNVCTCVKFLFLCDNFSICPYDLYRCFF